LDDKRNALLPDEKLGALPQSPLSEEDHAKNNLPDVLARWLRRDESERGNPCTAQSFCVSKDDIAATGTYDLSLNRYKVVEHDEQTHDAPAEIIKELRLLENEISDGLTKLEAMLG
jgi:type I restriction enzyme M protein